VRVASQGGFAGEVLDVGCGIGENTLHVASQGLSALGVDVAETALQMARKKAASLGVKAEFVTADALHLDRLGRKFQTVLDCALFHTFSSEERPEYVASLASVTQKDGTLYLLCFSAEDPVTGPHPVRQEELRAAFEPTFGWNVIVLGPDLIHTRYHTYGVPAWFAKIRRV
jgi:ubiquinone/menaquinone biosynthesis C-methylase UbiE